MIATRRASTDRDLVEAVRAGDDSAFEELYRRYHARIAAYVRRIVRDPARAEDLTQDVFFSALRRMRATDAEIAFKPWIFEIARNATIDHWRRTSRAEEVSVDADDELSQFDRIRLVGAAAPDSVLVEKERFEHLRGAFDELSDVHTRVLVMRELEGLSYREIAERLDLSRASVESALFRARRRLESEYADISEGRRCTAMRTVMARMAEGLSDRRDEGRLARHARRCHVCRRRARGLGVEPLAPRSGLGRKVAALLPLPLLPRRGGMAHGGAAAGGQSAGAMSGLLPAGVQLSGVVAERAAAVAATVALAGAGGVAIGGADVIGSDGGPVKQPIVEQRASQSGPKTGTDHSAPAGGHPRAGDKAGPTSGGDRAGEPGPRAHDGAGPAGSRQSADGARPRRSGANVDDAADPGAAGGPNGSAGAGGIQLPPLPSVPRDIAAAVSGGPSPHVPPLPKPPAAPSLGPPSAPDLPVAVPEIESAAPAPVEVPAVPELLPG